MADTITARPGETVYSELDNAPTGQVGTVGVRIIRKSDQVTVVARTTAGIVESPAGSGRYEATLTAPTIRGAYTILWDLGGALTPANNASDDLVVAFTLAEIVEPGTNVILTLAEYKALRGIEGTERDASLEVALPSAEDAIARSIARDILSDPITETRKFRYEGTIVNIDDCSDITEVKLDDAVLVNDENFIAEPYDRDQPFYWLDLSPFKARPASPEMGFMQNLDTRAAQQFTFITVSATFGWALIPRSLKLAVAMYVDETASPALEHRGISAEAVADTSVVYEAPEPSNTPPALPPAVEEIVKPFRKIVL